MTATDKEVKKKGRRPPRHALNHLLEQTLTMKENEYKCCTSVVNVMVMVLDVNRCGSKMYG